MASEKCFKPSEQTNHCAQTTNYYQKTTTTDACYDKHKPTYHDHSLVDKVKELAHSATKLFQPNDPHGHAAHNGHCAHGHGHGHGHSAHSHEHGHSAHGHGHGHSAHSHEHGYSAHGHGHGHSAHSHEHGHSAHFQGHTPTANYSTGAAHGGLNGHTANNGGHCFPKSHDYKKQQHRENKLSGCSSDGGSCSESECYDETPKKTC